MPTPVSFVKKRRGWKREIVTDPKREVQDRFATYQTRFLNTPKECRGKYKPAGSLNSTALVTPSALTPKEPSVVRRPSTAGSYRRHDRRAVSAVRPREQAQHETPKRPGNERLN
jgi:hypothetical protein